MGILGIPANMGVAVTEQQAVRRTDARANQSEVSRRLE